MLLCIDIGNTHTHFGLIDGNYGDIAPQRIPTAEIDHPDTALYREIKVIADSAPQGGSIAFCTVVPEAGKRLRRLIGNIDGKTTVFQLDYRTLPKSVRIHYPLPEEIGQDRLANAVATSNLFRLPCIVIDMGTAVTFDILSSRNGYEGGIIAPGIGVMTRYLHRQTALLPQLDDELRVDRAIGKSTREAMTIGCVIGFRGMLEALLGAIREDLSAGGETDPALILTGGSAEFLFREADEKREIQRNKLDGIEVSTVPDLTLKGLALAFRERNSE